MVLVGVVGPSGAGKDTLLAAARQALAGEGRIRFARRVITRPAEAGGEDHEAVSDTVFATRLAAGDFPLWWEAHGLRYGIPRAALAGEAAVVVASLSRTVLEEAARRHALVVVEITAPPAILAERLAARGREDAAAIAARLARQAPLPAGLTVRTIMNDGPVERGAAALVALLREAASAA